MSHVPLDPSNDPLLAKLGQLGVPAGGAPSATAAALLSKAAVVAPVVVGLAGAKLYAVIAWALLAGLGVGVVFTELVRDDVPSPVESGAVVQHAPSVEQCESLLGGEVPPEPEPVSRTTDADAVVEDGVESDVEPVPPRVVYVTRYVEVCDDAAAGGESPLSPGEDHDRDGDDDWVGEPDYETPAGPTRTPYSPEKLEAEPRSDATASSEVVPVPHRAAGRVQPAEGHLRLGLGSGGAVFPDGSMGNFAGAVGLELLGPGPVRAAPLLAANLDAGLIGAVPLGTLAFDGEVGVALRPQPDLRVSIAGVGGARFLGETYWNSYLEGLAGLTPEEERRMWEIVPSGPVTLPSFGGRIGLVLGDRRKSPLSFRASFTGQALFFRDPTREVTMVLPRIGGTVGLDILLPPPSK